MTTAKERRELLRVAEQFRRRDLRWGHWGIMNRRDPSACATALYYVGEIDRDYEGQAAIFESLACEEPPRNGYVDEPGPFNAPAEIPTRRVGKIERPPLPDDAMPVERYMAEMMDMHEVRCDQEQNQLCRHLSQWGAREYRRGFADGVASLNTERAEARAQIEALTARLRGKRR